MRKKFLSLLLAGILMSQIFTETVPVNAEESKVQAVIKTENLAEFQNAVMEQQKEWDVLTENESNTDENNTGVSSTTDVATISLEQEVVTESEFSFETRTLIVAAEKKFDTKGAVSVIRDSENLSVLIYETEEETKAAYEYLKELEGERIEAVTVDAVV